MSVAWSWSGVAADSASAPSPTYPATGVVAGDQVLLMVVNKPETAIPDTPAGFSVIMTGAGGSGTQGGDTGAVRITVFGKVAAGTEASSTIPVTVSGGTGVSAVLSGFTKTATNWVVVSAGVGSDTVANTTLTATAPTTISATAGDHLISFAALGTDSVNVSAGSTTIPGVTIGAWTERVDSGGTVGNDRRLVLYDAAVVAGPASGAATISFTLGASAPGAVGLLRLRETDGTAPIADAGDDQMVFMGSLVTLDGTGSFDSDGTIATYAWSQISGPAVTLSSSSAAAPTFTPAQIGTYVFGLVVSDNEDISSVQDVVTVQVVLAAGRYVALSGAWSYGQALFARSSTWQ